MRVRRTLPSFAAGEVDVPFVIKSYEEVLTEDTSWDEHSHPWHELLWNERGASTAVVGRQVWCITPTLGLWMPAGQAHSASAIAGTSFRAHFFRYGTTSALPDAPVAVEITPLLQLLLERLEEKGLSPESRAVTEAMVLDVLRPSQRALLVQLPTSDLLRPIVDAVRADPSDQRTLAGWAALLGCSPRTLTRAFRVEAGTSFARWVAAVRAQRAVQLLVQGTEVDDVAEAVGYRSASAFGAAFRRTTGTTPGRFRLP
ncbi:helix-turn-helix transcriptional regulator [Streptomyces tagetis]|uniref:HTH-type transcriptional regulator RipA n=1 Tax=Streptomyces tagetis TaxID=2820809 RepID=A0A940XHI0_9ACTN|nr:helix-turn-helix transcriptional regulator [Streptomyces sp. RG38]MBQ0826656.1 helix-turn-helix transcriptional regulator [Streptomyces sp. RG38]